MNARYLLCGRNARQWIQQQWNKPTLLLFGAHDPWFGSVQDLWVKDIFNKQALAYSGGSPIIVHASGEL